MGFTLLHTCCKRDRDWIKGLEKEMLLPDKFWFTISVKGGGGGITEIRKWGRLLSSMPSMLCHHQDRKHHNILFK